MFFVVCSVLLLFFVVVLCVCVCVFVVVVWVFFFFLGGVIGLHPSLTRKGCGHYFYKM